MPYFLFDGNEVIIGLLFDFFCLRVRHFYLEMYELIGCNFSSTALLMLFSILLIPLDWYYHGYRSLIVYDKLYIEDFTLTHITSTLV